MLSLAEIKINPVKNEKIMPDKPQQKHHPQTEASLIGACLLDPQAIAEIKGLEPKHLLDKRHRYIFEAVLKTQTKDRDIDIITVGNALKEAKVFKEAGGNEHLLSLIHI